MISIVIRNKNEADALNTILAILTDRYSGDYNEIIIVDNASTDNSKMIAAKYGCKVVNIDDFSYGRATNLGIEKASSDFVLLLSAHAIPIGKSFFNRAVALFNNNKNLAGVRFINSIENYKRAIENDFKVLEPLKYGLMTACSIVNKKVWLIHKFDVELPFSEDKEWSDRVCKNGFEIEDLDETFFYFIKRDFKSNVLRYKNETLSGCRLHNQTFPSLFRIILSFFKKIFFTNSINYFKIVYHDFLILKAKMEIRKEHIEN
jgi:glycosyltransferase involved in cell wall biosynthesis